MPTLFDLPLHEDFVQRHSEVVEYIRCRKCPCGALPDGSRSNVNCKACKGRGLIEDPPITFSAIVVGVRAQKSFLEAGIVSFGDLMLSAPPFLGLTIFEYDKFRITGWPEGEPYEGEIIRRNIGDVDRLKYEPIVIHKVFTVDPATGAVTAYTQGTHFSVTDRDLTWLGATRPASGQAYTVDYSPRWEWVAFIPTVIRREQSDSLGQLVILKKLHTTTPF
jgi:hypothetical protein